jgi:hypothetical protein
MSSLQTHVAPLDLGNPPTHHCGLLGEAVKILAGTHCSTEVAKLLLIAACAPLLLPLLLRLPRCTCHRCWLLLLLLRLLVLLPLDDGACG